VREGDAVRAVAVGSGAAGLVETVGLAVAAEAIVAGGGIDAEGEVR
jgi:hypothetical protein